MYPISMRGEKSVIYHLILSSNLLEELIFKICFSLGKDSFLVSVKFSVQS